jgi:hypothetical protein
MRAACVISNTEGGRRRVAIWAQLPTGTDVNKVEVDVVDTGESGNQAAVKIQVAVENKMMNAEAMLGHNMATDRALTYALQASLNTEFRSKTESAYGIVVLEQVVKLPQCICVEPTFVDFHNQPVEDPLAVTLVQFPESNSTVNGLLIFCFLMVAEADNRTPLMQRRNRVIPRMTDPALGHSQLCEHHNSLKRKDHHPGS